MNFRKNKKLNYIFRDAHILEKAIKPGQWSSQSGRKVAGCGEAHSDRVQSPWWQHIFSFRASSLQLFLMLFTYNFYSAVMLYVCSI